MGVEITQLRLRGPPEAAVQARFLIEDGIRTAWPDEQALVLVRRVALGAVRPGGRAVERQAAFRRAYDDATEGRRHGGDSGAAHANCVWFASRAEAWRLLLRELLAGRTPAAWFWRLAVPEWRGEAAEPWLAARLEEALAGRGPIDAVALIETVEATGGLSLLFSAAERVAARGTAPLGGAPKRARDAASSLKTKSPPVSGEVSAGDTEIVALAPIVARLPIRLVALIEALARRIGADRPATRRLLERLLLRASPSLRLTPAVLAARVRDYAAVLAAGDTPLAWQDAAVSRATAPAVPSGTGVPGEASLAAAEARRAEMGEARVEPQAIAPPPQPFAAPLFLPEAERATAGAGLWLVIPGLIRMGFREWLAERPELAAADAGRQLLRVIGRRYRIAPDDPALAPLGELEPERAFETAWRVGLDRYFRRRARIRLAEVVLRSGWIQVTEDRVMLRFPPEAADIRLRRRALDVDPGWTDWLGLVVRYRYAERGEA